MVNGESTKRSQLDAGHLTDVLRAAGSAALQDAREVTLIMDGMELRRPGAAKQAHLMRVKALDGSLVNGYRTVTVLGLGAGAARGVLYQRLFSSTAPDFISENQEVTAAITHTEAALANSPGAKTWVMDCGYDNDAVWWQIWPHPHSHLVVRVYHLERVVEWEVRPGVWEERYLHALVKQLQPLTSVETALRVRLHGQTRARHQSVTVHLAAVALRVRDPEDPTHTQPVWLVRAAVVGAAQDPWYLLTDWPVTDAASALRVFRFYRRRWSVEDTFKFVKTCFGVEAVQVLAFEAVRTLVALAWVAAGFLFHLGLTLDTAEVQLLARLGGWEPRVNRPPGKLILTRGLRRLLDLYAAEAVLQAHVNAHGDFPPFIKRLSDAYGYRLPEPEGK